MAFNNDSGIFVHGIRQTVEKALNSFFDIFDKKGVNAGSASDAPFTIDPLLRPRVPMSSEGIDINTQVALGGEGLRNVKLVTAQTHPELFEAWQIMCKRAALPITPQLMIAEGRDPNAFTLNPREVVVSTGLLKAMNFREVVSVLGHELGHERNEHNAPRSFADLVFRVGGFVVGNAVAQSGGLGKLATESFSQPNKFTRAMTWLFGHGKSHPSAIDYGLYIMSFGFLGNIIANQVAVKPTELQADIDGAAISGDPAGAAKSFETLRAFHQKSPLHKALGYLISGYPTLTERINNLNKLAETMPAQSVAEIVRAKHHGPTATVSGVADAERMQPDAAPELGAS